MRYGPKRYNKRIQEEQDDFNPTAYKPVKGDWLSIKDQIIKKDTRKKGECDR